MCILCHHSDGLVLFVEQKRGNWDELRQEKRGGVGAWLDCLGVELGDERVGRVAFRPSVHMYMLLRSQPLLSLTSAYHLSKALTPAGPVRHSLCVYWC